MPQLLGLGNFHGAKKRPTGQPEVHGGKPVSDFSGLVGKAGHTSLFLVEVKKGNHSPKKKRKKIGIRFLLAEFRGGAIPPKEKRELIGHPIC